MVVEKNSVSITIRGKKYPLRTGADSQRVQQVVEFVNKKLNDIDCEAGLQAKGGVTDFRLVLLVLLELADECLTHEQALNEVEKRSENLLADISSVGQ